MIILIDNVMESSTAINKVMQCNEFIFKNNKSLSVVNTVVELVNSTDAGFLRYLKAYGKKGRVSVIDARQIFDYPNNAGRVKIYPVDDDDDDDDDINNDISSTTSIASIRYLSHASPELIYKRNSNVLVLCSIDEILQELLPLNLVDDYCTSLNSFIDDLTNVGCTGLSIFLITRSMAKLPNRIRFRCMLDIQLKDLDDDLDNKIHNNSNNKSNNGNNNNIDNNNNNSNGNNSSDNKTNDTLLSENGLSWFQNASLNELIQKKTKNHKKKSIHFYSSKRIPISNDTTTTNSTNKNTIIPVYWSDIGGLASVRKEIMEVIQYPMDYPELFPDSLPRRRGILLFGPPGSGKTLIAKAVATEMKLSFISVKGPELLDMYVGESERNIRELFQSAKRQTPCVLFFDELDSIAPTRGKASDSGGVIDRCVSQLLTEVDQLNQPISTTTNGNGIDTNGNNNIYIIGATNRPDLLDPSLLSPGRFDRRIYLAPSKDINAQIEIFAALMRRFRFDDTINLHQVCQQLPVRATGADIADITTKAYLHAQQRLMARIQSQYMQERATCNSSSSSSTTSSSNSHDNNISSTNNNNSSSNNNNSSNNNSSSSNNNRANMKQYIDSLPKSALRVRVTQQDLLQAVAEMKPSVSEEELRMYESNSTLFGYDNE